MIDADGRESRTCQFCNAEIFLTVSDFDNVT